MIFTGIGAAVLVADIIIACVGAGGILAGFIEDEIDAFKIGILFLFMAGIITLALFASTVPCGV